MSSGHRIARSRWAAAAGVLVLAAGLATGACDESPTSATGTDDPGGGAGSSLPPTTATLSGTRFLAFGDSITAGEVTAPVNGVGAVPFVVVPSASYPAQLQDRLRSRYTSQAGQISVMNAGAPELASAAAPRLADLLANAARGADALLLLDGAEDLLNYGANGVSAAIGGMNELAREGRRRGARVFIAYLPPSIQGRQRSVPDAAIRSYNDQLSIVVRGEGAVGVDLYAALSQDLNRYIGVDGLHPTEAGYRRIADEFLASIASTLER
ncbi:MAG: SGNH/GDSL hydrolase family protein [Vicinamibacterales bacterium]